MSSQKSDLDRIKRILDKLTNKKKLNESDILFLVSRSSNEEIQAMKTIIYEKYENDAAEILASFKSKSLGGKRKRTLSKKSNKNKKRKSYRKR